MLEKNKHGIKLSECKRNLFSDVYSMKDEKRSFENW